MGRCTEAIHSFIHTYTCLSMKEDRYEVLIRPALCLPPTNGKERTIEVCVEVCSSACLTLRD